jgi:hypothetical protein
MKLITTLPLELAPMRTFTLAKMPARQVLVKHTKNAHNRRFVRAATEGWQLDINYVEPDDRWNP